MRVFWLQNGSLLLVALLLACGGAPDLDPGGGEAVLDHEGLQIELLAGTVLSDAPAIGMPLDIVVSGEEVLVLDAAGDPALHVLDARTGVLIRSIGARGEGPGEFSRSASEIGWLASANAAWLFDMGLQRVTLLDPANQREPIVNRLTGAPVVQRLVRLNSDRMVGISASDTARFAIFAGDGRRLSNIAGPLLGSREEVSIAQQIRASNTMISVCPRSDGQGFAIVYGAAGRIEYYDREADFQRQAKVPFPSDAVFVPAEQGDSLVYVRTRQWYTDCAVTTSRLYALFSGRRLNAFPRGEGSSGEYVHVFDWNGDLQGVWKLDRPVIGIGVDEARKVLYGVSVLDATVIRFDWPRRSGTPSGVN